MADVDRAAAEAKAQWLTCTVEGCDAPKVICRQCGGMSNEVCGPHGVERKEWATQENVFFYHDKHPVKKPSVYKPHQTCAMRLCVQCWKKPAHESCQCKGYLDGVPHERCAVAFNKELCIDCTPGAHKKVGWAGIYCTDCIDRDTKRETCGACGAVHKGKYQCWVCHKAVCKACSPSKNVDISPITLYGGGLAVGVTAVLCADCGKTHDDRRIQDMARARDAEASARAELERGKRLVAEAKKLEAGEKQVNKP